MRREISRASSHRSEVERWLELTDWAKFQKRQVGEEISTNMCLDRFLDSTDGFL